MSLREACLAWALNHRGVALHFEWTVVLLAALFVLVALWPALRPGAAAAGRGGRFVFFATLVVFFLVARLPGLLAPQLNPDEGLFTAAAEALLRDGRFWISVDTGSSGLLNVWPLTWPALFGLRPDYSTARLTGLVALLSSLALLYGAFRAWFGEAVARIALVPVVLVLAWVQHPHLLHYGSEHIPALLTALAVYGLAQVQTQPRPPAWACWLQGLAVGAMPLVKMQGVPIAAALALLMLATLWSVRRTEPRHFWQAAFAWLVGAGTAPLLVGLHLLATGAWPLFVQSYLQLNLVHYAGMSITQPPTGRPSSVRYLLWSPHLRLLVLIVGGWALMAALACFQRKPANRDVGRIAGALLVCAAAAFAVIKPGTQFVHYLLLFVVPLGLLGGALLHVVLGDRPDLSRWTARIALLILLISPIPTVKSLTSTANPFLAQAPVYARDFHSPLVSRLRELAPPGSLMTVWGWSPDLYVQSGLVQATRFGFCSWLVEPNPWRDGLRAQFLQELQQNRPLLFVDAMAPEQFYFPLSTPVADRVHERFPALVDLLARDYELVDTVAGARIYRRRAP